MVQPVDPGWSCVPATQPTERALGAAAASSFSCAGLCDARNVDTISGSSCVTSTATTASICSFSRTSSASAAGAARVSAGPRRPSARSTRQKATNGRRRCPGGRRNYRLCANYTQHNVCNWALPADDAEHAVPVVPPDAGHPEPVRPGIEEAWYRLEVAKRRLVYTPARARPAARQPGRGSRARAGLRVPGRPGRSRRAEVLTGHAGGVITINLAEADDAERERRRVALHEPYRTLLGHFRHEFGHYYWDRLIARQPSASTASASCSATSARTTARRSSATTAKARRPTGSSASSAPTPPCTRGRTGPRPGRTTCTWSTPSRPPRRAACRSSPRAADEPSLTRRRPRGRPGSFEQLIESWLPLTYVLNNLNRGLGCRTPIRSCCPTRRLQSSASSTIRSRRPRSRPCRRRRPRSPRPEPEVQASGNEVYDGRRRGPQRA